MSYYNFLNYNKKRVFIISDSVGLPREKCWGNDKKLHYYNCEYNSTWPALLKNDYEVVQFSVGGCTITSILDHIGHYAMFYPEIVIFQVGIVDCAPRALSEMQKLILPNYYFGRLYIKLIKSNPSIFRRIRKKVFTTPHAFNKQLFRLPTIFKKNPIIISIGIIEPKNKIYIKRLPGIEKNIKQYNNMLKIHFKSNFISLSDMPKEYLMADSVHFTDKAHEFVYNKVDTLISNNT